ncbi:MAG: SMP-30/gluconolactonase/LRE family protein [Proteobacteria bacterium]|nr:SMP-30/gluconolactonase/LRE family protein [Pseudomonadota bacterium]
MSGLSATGCGSSDGTAQLDAGMGAMDAENPASGDCSALPAISSEVEILTHVPDSEDFTFDREGYLVNVQVGTGALFKTAYDGQPQLQVPDVSGFARGTRVLPNDELVVVDSGRSGLLRIDETNAVHEVLLGLPNPNGVTVDMDGLVYVSHAHGEIRRIDPQTGEFAILHSDRLRSFDGIAFSADYRTLYFNEEEGAILAMAIDADGNPDEPSLLVELPVEFLLDGMATDRCGNLYVVEMAGLIWRVQPDGSAEMVIDIRSHVGNGLIPAVNFGSGKGGWKANALYIMDFAKRVYEVEVGIESKAEPHLPAPVTD